MVFSPAESLIKEHSSKTFSYRSGLIASFISLYCAGSSHWKTTQILGLAKRAALAIYLKLKDTFRCVLARGTLHSPIKDISALPERHNLLSPRQQDQCTHTLNALETKGRRSPLLVRMLGPITALWVVECEEICSSCDRLVGTLTPLIYVVEQTRLAAPRRGPVCVRAS